MFYKLSIFYFIFKKIIPKVHKTPVLWPFEPKPESISCNKPIANIIRGATLGNVLEELKL